MNIKVKTYDPRGYSGDKKRKISNIRLRALLFTLAGALLAATSVTFLVIYNEGNIAALSAKNHLAEYEQSITFPAEHMQEPGTSGVSPAKTAIPTIVPILQPYEDYQVIGKLVIEKIGQELPIISETTTAGLKISCCYYEGPMPGRAGNMVITGHNYTSGAIFGKLSELNKGDIVVLSTPTKDYTYEVYNTEVIKPYDVAALEEYESDMALTLLTCTSHGNRRLLVRCWIMNSN